MFGKVQKGPFSQKIVSCIVSYYEISSGNMGEFFFWLFSSFYNRNTRHEELFGHMYLTGRKEL